jgi:hypothetical protein
MAGYPYFHQMLPGFSLKIKKVRVSRIQGAKDWAFPVLFFLIFRIFVDEISMLSDSFDLN